MPSDDNDDDCDDDNIDDDDGYDDVDGDDDKKGDGGDYDDDNDHVLPHFRDRSNRIVNFINQAPLMPRHILVKILIEVVCISFLVTHHPMREAELMDEQNTHNFLASLLCGCD